MLRTVLRRPVFIRSLQFSFVSMTVLYLKINMGSGGFRAVREGPGGVPGGYAGGPGRIFGRVFGDFRGEFSGN